MITTLQIFVKEVVAWGTACEVSDTQVEQFADLNIISGVGRRAARAPHQHIKRPVECLSRRRT